MKIKIIVDITKIKTSRPKAGTGRSTYFKDKRKNSRTTDKINFKKGKFL